MGYVKTLIKEVKEAVEQISCEPTDANMCSILFNLSKLADAVDLIADSTEEACDDNE